jgi:hypothetical protein
MGITLSRLHLESFVSPPRPFHQQRKHESGNSLSTVERAVPLLLFFPRKRVALEIKRDLLQAECGRPEQSIKLAGLVFLVLHDEGVLLTEVRFSKLRSRQYHAVETNFASQV